MRVPLPVISAAGRDGLAKLSTVSPTTRGFRSVPAMADPPPTGWFEQVDGRGVFVRRTPGWPSEPGGSDGSLSAPADAWYIHGLAGSSTNWISLAGALSERAAGYTIDLPGHGRSDPPPRGHYSLAADAALLAGIIRRRSPGRVHLIGNSLGGVVATRLAARNPELVRTLTLISPAVPDLRITRDRGGDVRLALLLAPGTTGLALRQLTALSPLQRIKGMAELCFGDPTAITEPEYEAAALDMAWRTGLPWVHRATIGSLRSLMRGYLRARQGSFADDAARVRAPTLVIWGAQDRLVDARLAPRTAAAFADSRLLIFAGVGHTAQMEIPEQTAEAIRAHWDSAGAPHPALTDGMATSNT